MLETLSETKAAFSYCLATWMYAIRVDPHKRSPKCVQTLFEEVALFACKEGQKANLCVCVCA